MKKILILICLILQSCGTFGLVSYNTSSNKIVKVLTITSSGDTIASPISEFKNQIYERTNINYWNSWEYNRFNNPYYNDLYLRNRYFTPTYPVYRSYVRPKVKPKNRPRVEPPKRRSTPQPRVIPNNPPRRVNPPTRRITPRRVIPTRSGNNNKSSTKQ